jgi:hypothetical protein
VEVTSGDGGAAAHSFINPAAALVLFENSSVGPLAFSESGSFLTIGGGGVDIAISTSNFTSIMSTADAALIFSDNVSVAAEGMNTISLSDLSFTGLTVLI